MRCPAAISPGKAFVVTLQADAAPDSASVVWQDKTVTPRPTPGGEGWTATALLGLDIDDTATRSVARALVAAGGETLQLDCVMDIAPVAYEEQHLSVGRKYVSLSQEDLDRHWNEKARVTKVLESVSPLPGLQPPLVRPVPGVVNSPFGLRRFFNGEPRKPHSGVDLHASQDDPVLACADGVVVLAEEHFFAGNAVYIDHGQGAVSMYMHLSAIDVATGEKVSAGQVLGRIGATGRVTGPHLHFGLSVLSARVDPLPLFEE